VSDYRLDDRAIEVRPPAGAKNFSSNLCVQTGSGAHPASCTVGTSGPFPAGKARLRLEAGCTCVRIREELLTVINSCVLNFECNKVPSLIEPTSTLQYDSINVFKI
jgi:hypothetical protein